MIFEKNGFCFLWELLGLSTRQEWRIQTVTLVVNWVVCHKIWYLQSHSCHLVATTLFGSVPENDDKILLWSSRRSHFRALSYRIIIVCRRVSSVPIPNFGMGLSRISIEYLASYIVSSVFSSRSLRPCSFHSKMWLKLPRFGTVFLLETLTTSDPGWRLFYGFDIWVEHICTVKLQNVSFSWTERGLVARNGQKLWCWYLYPYSLS